MIYILIAIAILGEIYVRVNPDSKYNMQSQAYRDAHIKHYSVMVHNYKNEHTCINADALSEYEARKIVEENYRVTVDKVVEL